MNEKYLKMLDEAKTPGIRKMILDNILFRDDAVYIIKGIFGELTKRDYYQSMASDILCFLADFPGFADDEILFSINVVPKVLKKLTTNQIESIITYTPNAIDEILKYVEYLDLSNGMIIRFITSFLLKNRFELFDDFQRQIILLGNKDALTSFIVEIIQEEYEFDFERLYPQILDCKYNSFPALLTNYVYNASLKAFLVKHFDEFLDIEVNEKMYFIERLKNSLPKDIKEKYDYLFKIYRVSMLPMNTLKSLNIALKHNDEGFIKDYVGNEDVSYIQSGSSSQAFKIGEDKVLKFCKLKHMEDTETESFLLAPTERKIIYEDKKPILYIEEQGYLSKTHNGVYMNDRDLDNFFNELDRQNLVLHDPHCVRRFYDNFGFLKDYHDAQLAGVANYDELPLWFKLRPIVLFDIDLVRKKRVIKRNLH